QLRRPLQICEQDGHLSSWQTPPAADLERPDSGRRGSVDAASTLDQGLRLERLHEAHSAMAGVQPVTARGLLHQLQQHVVVGRPRHRLLLTKLLRNSIESLTKVNPAAADV